MSRRETVMDALETLLEIVLLVVIIVAILALFFWLMWLLNCKFKQPSDEQPENEPQKETVSDPVLQVRYKGEDAWVTILTAEDWLDAIDDKRGIEETKLGGQPVSWHRADSHALYNLPVGFLIN